MSRRFQSALLVCVGIALGVPSPTVAQLPTPDAIQSQYAQRVLYEPNNPELFFQIAVTYWDTAYRDANLTAAQKSGLIAKGIVNVDRAIALKQDYREALVYKGLLLRLQATLETDSWRQQALIREADELRDKAATIPR